MIGYTQSLLIQAGVCAATMEALFDTGQGQYGPNFAPDFLSQYWALMAGHLTTLKLVIGTAFTEHKSMALNHLTRLLCLVLAAADQEPIAIDVPGNIILSMPLLQQLEISGFDDATVALECPRLITLQIQTMHPLKRFSGMPASLESMHLDSLGEEGVFVDNEFFSDRILGNLTEFRLLWCSADLEATKEHCFTDKLLMFETDYSLYDLFPTEEAWTSLPQNLQYLSVACDMYRGLPRELEQLTNLKELIISRQGADGMHLDRPLDPFLEMPSLQKLEFTATQSDGEGRIGHWTPNALKILGLAQNRIFEMELPPGNTPISLLF